MNSYQRKGRQDPFCCNGFSEWTRLFTDPDWDGLIEQDDGFQYGGYNPKGGSHGGGENNPPDSPIETPIVDRDDCQVKIINKTVSVYKWQAAQAVGHYRLHQNQH